MEKQRVGQVSEDELIRRFFAPIADDLSNDTAALEVPEQHLMLVSSDALMEGIHFLRESPARLVGQKVLRVNASDILADGGKPRWMTLSLAMPRDVELRWLAGFTEGLSQALAETGIKLVGGDTTAAMGQIAITVTMIGTVPADRRVGRHGGGVGDWIGITGDLGGAALGLDMVLGKHAELEPLERYFWMERHFCPPFRGRFAQGIAAQGLVTAMMDLSDGLLCDLPRLCRASGTGARVELNRLPVSDEARALGLTPEDAARSGEDYELLFTTHHDHWQEIEAIARWADTPVTRIGALVEDAAVQFLMKGKPLKNELPTWKHFG